MSGTLSNSFIHFLSKLSRPCGDKVSLFILNICSRSRNFKTFADSEKATSRFSFQQLEELRAFGIRSVAHFPYPLGFEIQNHELMS